VGRGTHKDRSGSTPIVLAYGSLRTLNMGTTFLYAGWLMNSVTVRM